MCRSSRPEVFCKKDVLRNFAKFTGFIKNFIKKETLAQVFSCEFYEISKNTFFHRTPRVAASECDDSKTYADDTTPHSCKQDIPSKVMQLQSTASTVFS